MSTRTVTNQAELDQAIRDKVDLIRIHSDPAVYIVISELGSSRAELRESSRAVLWGSSRAELRESSRAELWGSSRAVLRESSRAVLRESSRAVLRESSRAVLWESSSAALWESSSAELRESSRAVLRGSSSAELRESSRAVLRGSSRAVLWESSSAELWESSSAKASEASTVSAFGGSVRASPLVAVHLHSATVDVKGGVIIDHTHVADMDGAAWCVYHGVEVKRGIATLYKAVNDRWTTDRGTDYSPGSKPSCDDFKDTDACGGGLHFGPSPSCARVYFESATKYVAVGVKVSEMRPINGGYPKCKAPRVVRACREVDIHGKPVEAKP